jgi:hypothetical protein
MALDRDEVIEESEGEEEEEELVLASRVRRLLVTQSLVWCPSHQVHDDSRCTRMVFSMDEQDMMMMNNKVEGEEAVDCCPECVKEAEAAAVVEEENTDTHAPRSGLSPVAVPSSPSSSVLSATTTTAVLLVLCVVVAMALTRARK